jgi:cytoskeleton protein RodZ
MVQGQSVISENPPIGPAANTGVAVLLRETRLKLGRDIAVVATTLRIRQPYLQAIEDGRFQDLPGATYAVGFVRGYAEYLGLDGNEIVRRFKQENSDLAGRAELVFPSTASGSGIPTGALIGVAVIAAAIAYGVWYWMQDREEVAAEAVPPLPERLAALIHKPVGDGTEVVPAQEAAKPAEAASAPVAETAPPPPAPVETAPPPAPTPEPAKVEGDNPTQAAAAAAPEPPKPAPIKINWTPSKRVKLTAKDTCWIKIRDANGQVILSRLLHEGDSFAPPNTPGLEMTVGSAGALTVLVDGKELPPLGPAGQVKHLSLDPDKLDKTAPKEEPAPNDNN